MSQALAIFLAALDNKSNATKETYSYHLKKYLQYQQVSSYERLLEHQKPEDIENKIKDYLEHLKSAGSSYSVGNNAFWALRKFYAANRITLNWDWIGMFKPKADEKEQREDRPYTKEEIQTILSEADERTKCAILIMATGGPRVGALKDIRIKDLEWLERHDLYSITVYPHDKNAKYRTFVTPQASQFIDEYKGKREEFLFVSKRESDMPITEEAFKKDIWRVLQKAGLRTVSNSYERKEVQMDHGFRKFATTTWALCGLEKEYRELLDGQNPGIQKRYAKLTAMEIMELSKYELAIPTLTF